MAFEKNVFVNCPFDQQYLPLLRPLLFAVIYLKLKPRIALEAMDAGQARLDTIVELIADSKFGIHDLSRIESAKAGELFRLNMPFELGLDFGCRRFGSDLQKGKRSLVLETEPYRYKAALSDLSGSDVQSHGNEPYRVIAIVRNWLKNVCRIRAAGPARIEGAFTDFMTQNYDDLTAKGFSPRDIEALPIPELIECMEDWVATNTQRPPMNADQIESEAHALPLDARALLVRRLLWGLEEISASEFDRLWGEESARRVAMRTLVWYQRFQAKKSHAKREPCFGRSHLPPEGERYLPESSSMFVGSSCHC